MHVAVDMDDVMLEFTQHILDCVAREYGPSYGIEEITDWDDNPLKHDRRFVGGGTWWDWLRTRDWLWAKAPAVPGAVGGIQQLRDMGHHVELLTTKPTWAEWTVWAWLGKWRPAVHQVTIVPTGGSKADYSDALILVDDALHNLVPWAATGRTAIVYDRPWNQAPEGPTRRLWRAHNWGQVVRRIEELT